jgi:threonine dehydrogenase-like Zn-dependent dehydrogenase
VARRLAAASAFGAHVVLDAGRQASEEIVRAVRDACAPDGADVVIEVCGVADVIPSGLDMLRAGGRYVVGGLVNPGSDLTIDGNLLLRRCLTLRGSTIATPGTWSRRSTSWWGIAVAFHSTGSSTRGSRSATWTRRSARRPSAVPCARRSCREPRRSSGATVAQASLGVICA